MLKDKNILIGISGSIACYKTISLVRSLKKNGANVFVIMTKNATNFVSPLIFESLTDNKCLVETFDINSNIEHIEISKKADLFLVAPATANLIAKLANGIADDMLTTTFLASNSKKIIYPAMNTNMYENPITKDNIKKLKSFGINVMETEFGELACKDVGCGKMQEPEKILEYIIKEIAFEKDLKGKNVLVTAGATREFIDPVRFLSNPSTGKMGLALAKACMLRGANVTLVCGHIESVPSEFLQVIKVVSAKQMFDSVKKIYKNYDIIFKTAAVSDFTPEITHQQKIKKGSIKSENINFIKTDDILKFLGENKQKNQIICGFSMETENLIENSRKKLINKNLDYIVANNLNSNGGGFALDTNVATIIKSDGQKSFEKMSKFELSHKILDYINKKEL